MILKDTECLLFDMDGVILDNTYDNNFWQNQIPSVLFEKIFHLTMLKDWRYKFLIIKKIVRTGMILTIGPICLVLI